MLIQLYLTSQKKDLLVGSFIAGVKSIKDVSDYSKGIQKGIALHQQIREFAENDTAVIESRKRLNPKYSKYAPSIVDFFYDHLLAANWNLYSSESLQKFSLNTYRILLEHQHDLPYKAKYLLPRMIRGNWLQNLETVGGVHQVINQMDIKSTKLTHIISALEDLMSDYKEFQNDFHEFFPKVTKHVNSNIENSGFSSKNLITVL